MSDEHRALLAHISLFDKTDDFALLGLAKKLHAADTGTLFTYQATHQIHPPILTACLSQTRSWRR
jgi:hypothetical protein